MAHYKNGNVLVQNQDAAFDALHDPGYTAPYAGIYRCRNCGKEIGIAEGHTLPPQNHATHSAAKGAIKWQLIVWADHNLK